MTFVFMFVFIFATIGILLNIKPIGEFIQTKELAMMNPTENKEALNDLYECNNPDCGLSFRTHQYINFSLARKYSGCPHCQTLLDVGLDSNKIENNDFVGVSKDLSTSFSVMKITDEKILDSRKNHQSCPSITDKEDYKQALVVIKELNNLVSETEVQNLYKDYDEKFKDTKSKFDFKQNISDSFKDIEKENNAELDEARLEARKLEAQVRKDLREELR